MTKMSRSPYIDNVVLTKKHSGKRTHKVQAFVIHHMAAKWTGKRCAEYFRDTPSRQASANYCIGYDGDVALNVEETNRAWTSSSAWADNRAITYELGNSKTGHPWEVSDKTINKLIVMLAEQHKRYGIKKASYTGDTSGTLWRHDWFASTNCPGPYLGGKLSYIANEVNKILSGKESAPTPSKPTTSKSASNNAKLVKNEDAYFLATTNIKVRNAPSTKATHTGTLKKGDSIHYYKVYEGNGYRWLQYVGNSGNKLYLPYRESGSGKEQWGTFHSSRPGSKSAPKKKTVAQMAKEVNAGKHGTGHANRRKSLGISQSEYDKVRAEVNRLSGVKTSSKPSLTIDQMANKIINDKNAPTGHEARRKWLGINNATYQKVRARVNQKLR